MKHDGIHIDNIPDPAQSLSLSSYASSSPVRRSGICQ